MCQVNIFEAKTELSKLIRSLETGEEKIVYIARNGKPIVQMTLLDNKSADKRIGVARGAFTVPDDFDRMDIDVAALFEESL